MVIRRILSSCWETNPVCYGVVGCWFAFWLSRGGCDVLTCWFEVLLSRSVYGTGILRKLSWVVSDLTCVPEVPGAWFVSQPKLFWLEVFSGRCQSIVLNWIAALSSHWFKLTFKWPNWYIDFVAWFMKNMLCEHKKKSKAVVLQAWSGPEGSRKLRFPDYMAAAQDGGKVSLTHRLPLPPGNAPGTRFC
jgi:hypothetical protein